MENPNPYAPPVAETTAPPAPSRAAPSGELLSEYAVKRLDRGGHGEAWMLLVYPDRLDAVSPDGVAASIPRDTLGERLIPIPTGQNVALKLRTEKTLLELPLFSAASFRRDLGDDLVRWAEGLSLQETKHALITGMALAAVWFLTGGLIAAVIAIANLIAGVGRWIRPGRWLFLLAALRAFALIVAVGFDVFVLGVAPWLAILALFFMLGAVMSIRRFGFFKPAAA